MEKGVHALANHSAEHEILNCKTQKHDEEKKSGRKYTENLYFILYYI